MWTTIAVLLGLGWLLCVDYSLKAGFHKVGFVKAKIGSKAFWKALGLRSADTLGHVGQEIPSSCVKEYSYLSLLSFIDVWTVGFDDTKRIVWKYRYTSPEPTALTTHSA